VVRVRTFPTIRRPDIRELVLRAVAATRYPGADSRKLYDELRDRIADLRLGVFVGFEGEPKALVVALLPDSQLMMYPQIPIVYSEGRPMLIRHVAIRLKEWIMAAGYDRMLSVSFNHSAAAWSRAFRHLGEFRSLGEMIECKFRCAH
jgi:hypothetical protein